MNSDFTIAVHSLARSQGAYQGELEQTARGRVADARFGPRPRDPPPASPRRPPYGGAAGVSAQTSAGSRAAVGPCPARRGGRCVRGSSRGRPVCDRGEQAKPAATVRAAKDVDHGGGRLRAWGCRGSDSR